MKYFKGDIDELIKDFSFNKLDQNDVENSMYEVYELIVNDKVKIGLEVYHFIDDDNIIFNLVLKDCEVRINVYSSIDLKEILKYF